MQTRESLMKLSPDFSATTPLRFNPTFPTFRNDNFFISIPGAAALSPEMEGSVRSVEAIIGYSFRRKKLLEEALTHSSFSESLNYERLEFIGDAVLGLATSNHLFVFIPTLTPVNSLFSGRLMLAPRGSLVSPFVKASLAICDTMLPLFLIR